MGLVECRACWLKLGHKLLLLSIAGSLEIEFGGAGLSSTMSSTSLSWLSMSDNSRGTMILDAGPLGGVGVDHRAVFGSFGR